MSRLIRVRLGKRSYPIRIGEVVPVAASLRRERSVRFLLVSDSNVNPIYGNACEKALRADGHEVRRAVIPAGEESKSGKQLFRVYECAAKAGLDRSAVILALGGGVVGDLAGFAAATYLRGIRLVQVPTTLLAMVDSSVGGKTGINLATGKNLVGAFHQPVEVNANLTTLRTLPRREYCSGLAEVVKYGVIRDFRLFRELETRAAEIMARHPPTLERIVARCCEIKADVVSRDERESGLREILNFGHTLAHALEARLGYRGLLHGEAVSLGMVFAADISRECRGFTDGERRRLVALLGTFGLPVRWRDVTRITGHLRRPAWREIRRAMGADKKARANTPRFVLADRIGRVIPGCRVEENILAEVWNGIC